MYHPSDTFTHYVSHIDTLSINGIAHRRWYFTHIMPNTIDYEVVEGAGCMRDPLTPYFPKQPYGSGWFLKCFSNAHTGTTASNPSWYTSNCMLSIDDLVSISDAIKMYPNPAHEDVSLELQAATNRATLITVYDNIGRLLLRLIPQPGQQKLKLNTSGWTSGVYLVNASFQDGTFRTVKLVIEN